MLVLSERERLLLLMAVARFAIECPHLAVEMKAIAEKFGGLRGWELIEQTQTLREMNHEGCVRQ